MRKKRRRLRPWVRYTLIGCYCILCIGVSIGILKVLEKVADKIVIEIHMKDEDNINKEYYHPIMEEVPQQEMIALGYIETSVPVVVENEMEKIIESEDLSAELQNYAFNLCEENEFPFEVFMALMYKESTYNPDCISKDGRDKGICQIRDVNYKWLHDNLGELDYLNPKDSMKASMFIIKDIEARYNPKTIHHLLMMYNMGPTGAKKLIKNGSESSKYSRSIMEYASSIGYKE